MKVPLSSMIFKSVLLKLDIFVTGLEYVDDMFRVVNAKSWRETDYSSMEFDLALVNIISN